MGDKFHPKLNISRMPIANKYREGKMKRTLKRELKGPEIAEGEAVERNFQLKIPLYHVQRTSSTVEVDVYYDLAVLACCALLRKNNKFSCRFVIVIGYVCFGWPVLKHGPRSLTYMRV